MAAAAAERILLAEGIVTLARFAILFLAVALAKSSFSAQAATGLRTFNVAEYDAVANDGADDTAYIQAAIDAAENYAALQSDYYAIVDFPRGSYEITGLVIDNPRIALTGYDARLELRTHALVGSTYNQMLWIKGEADSEDAEFITIRGLTLDGNYPAVNNSGTGVGFNIRANNVKLIDVTCEATEDATFISAFCDNTEYFRCVSRNAGEGAFRPRGDNQVLVGCRAYNWNVVNLSNGPRAILADGQEMDAESILIDDFFGQISEARNSSTGILIDSGDGDRSGSNEISCGNSGQATEVRGKAQWTIDVGHGYEPGDGFKLQESGVAAYDGDTSTTSICHKITAITGEAFVYVVDANTLKLYTSAQSAKENGGNSTNRYDLTDSGTGTFYIKSAGGLNKTFTVASTVDDTITVTNHRFRTGKSARLMVGTAGSDILPTGLKNAATITTNTDYAGAGSGAKYWRPKRTKNATLRDVRFDMRVPDTTDSNIVKVNNVNNLLIDRLQVSQSPIDADGSPSNYTLRIGQGCRKVQLINSVLPNGFVNNTRSWIPELIVDKCEIGTSDWVPETAFATLQVGKLSLTNSTVRFSLYGLETSDQVQGFRDADCDGWEIHDNIFEGASTSRTRVFAVNDASHFRHSGIVRYYNNTRRNPLYSGMTFTAAASDVVTLSTNSNLETGDIVYVSSSITLPFGLSATQRYYFRRTGDATGTLHTDLPGSTDDTNRADVTDTGTGTHTMHSDKLGVALTNASPRDRGFVQRGGSGNQFVAVTAPSNSSFEFRAGDIVWSMNPASGSTPGWICTKTGVAGSTAATFVALPSLP